MGDSTLKIIPSSPAWVPPTASASQARAVLTVLAPESEGIETTTTEEVAFIDGGENWGGVGCPVCGTPLEVIWWSAAMSRAYEESHFSDLGATAPCCGARTTLYDLEYGGPWVGFSRWILYARNPRRGILTEPELQQLEEALGAPVRQVWAHT